VPSVLARFVDRPQNFLALHFAIGVWDSNIGEVMGHAGTDAAVFERLLKFAEEIGLVPIPIRKEQGGYIINSLLVPWCTAALGLLVSGVSDFESIDRTWMITLQTGMGPFGMMDRMGLGVVYHVAKLIGETTPNTQALDSARYLDEHFIQKGLLGVASGQGFYRYPTPPSPRLTSSEYRLRAPPRPRRRRPLGVQMFVMADPVDYAQRGRLTQQRRSHMPTTMVLVHGAFAESSSWNDVAVRPVQQKVQQ
jgi:3-hydroxyacyl-CoA dehydrogenase